MENQLKYFVKSYKTGYSIKIWENMANVITEDRRFLDIKETIVDLSYNQSQLFSIVIEDGDERYKDIGQLSIFYFNKETNKAQYVTQEEFLHKIMENDKKTFTELIHLIKTRLNSLKDRPKSRATNCSYEDDFKLYVDKNDTNIRFISSYNEKSPDVYVFGVNINKEFITQALINEFDPYQPVDIKEDEEQFHLSSTGIEFIHVRFEPIVKKEEITQLIKKYLDLITDKEFKLEEVRTIQEMLKYYPDYVKYYASYNYKCKAIVEDIKQNFIKNNKLKMPYSYTDQENEKWTNYHKEINKIYQEDFKIKYHKGKLFESFLRLLKIRTNSSLITNKKLEHLPIMTNDIDTLNKKGIKTTFDVEAKFKEYKEELHKKYGRNNDSLAASMTVRYGILPFLQETKASEYYIIKKDDLGYSYVDTTPHKLKVSNNGCYDLYETCNYQKNKFDILYIKEIVCYLKNQKNQIKEEDLLSGSI